VRGLNEVFDTFDENMNRTGVATRQEVHRLGLWHRTFHCWVLHRDRNGDALVLQLRHPSKDTHPNKLDISCAGHLEVGESPADGIRELREELGIEVEFESLFKLGVYKYSDASGGVHDNEFCHVFALIQQDKELVTYDPALGEVSGLYLANVNDMQSLCRSDTDQIDIRGFALADNGKRFEQVRTIRLSDLVRYDASYYEMLFTYLCNRGLFADDVNDT
jgi:isopentenyldiphosphate isomerase